EVTGNFAADITAIEIVKAGMCEMLESCSKLSLLEPGADVRNFAINQECFFEADRFVHLRQFFCRQPGLAASDRVAVARVLDGGGARATSQSEACRPALWLLPSQASTRRLRPGQ